MILMIDNYDSFTYNLVQYLGELGEKVSVFRNDKINIESIEEIAPSRIMISPGPCTPNEAGVSLEVIRYFTGKLPILGVCLGHQSIGQAFGAKIVRAQQVMHGKISSIYHSGTGVFQHLPNPFAATRYHSLVIDAVDIPDCLEVTAWTLNAAGDKGEIMGVRHKEFPIEGVQFHPESILSENGHQLLKTFLSNHDR
ncbi:MAG: aminodeoxychorismate/anthranilate synthase component II [Gammaproteobacteria bacterium]|nr:aminodeoxychorismate/anthranilate synthase component II [Gammaproteobacteria bacterium]